MARTLFHSLPKVIAKFRMNYLVQPQEATLIVCQIHRAEALSASYNNEILRLKRLLAACPPPDCKIPAAPRVTLKSCSHACCDTSIRPPRASAEMLRLRRVVQQLQHRRQTISHLPPELLRMVFSYAVLPEKRDPFYRTALAAVRMAHVCSYWRIIVFDMSKLWTTILLRRPTSQHMESIGHLEFYADHAKTRPLILRCTRWPGRLFRQKLTRMSQRWLEIDLTIDNPHFDELNVVRQKIPFLKSLCIRNSGERDGAQTNDAFEFAPSLRRVALSVGDGYIWPFSFVLPWEQITSLTLNPISLSVFSECIRNCPQLLYFNAVVYLRPAEVVQPMAELRSPLRKLVLQGSECQVALIAHTFPHLLSLSIDMNWLHPEFFAFLARASRLEMLAVRACRFVTTENLLALLLAAPSLRILHFRDWRTAMVTPKFRTTLIPPAADDPFIPAEPQSLAELGIEGCWALDDFALRAILRARAPSLDPYRIESARLQIQDFPFDPEAELDYLLS
ncbi:hypothetical protein C8R43DRAFT_620206 [Mycena crocata]|nr:hypothetical protein C8R43DRAFT_620206 [Mycena crocata]